jgi:hypothetical protein
MGEGATTSQVLRKAPVPMDTHAHYAVTNREEKYMDI